MQRDDSTYPSDPPRLGTYSFGRIEIDGHTYDSDVIVLPCGVKDN